jgi:predicted HAD superfamily Cof-like phosphohydrolase
MAAFMGWDLDEAMKRVFESNMSKLGEDGRPVRREDGKILKGALYKPPTLSDLVNKSDA